MKPDKRAYEELHGDYERVCAAARGLYEALPLCTVCRELGKEPSARATCVSELGQHPVCAEHATVFDVRIVDSTALKRLLAELVVHEIRSPGRSS